ncbi:MAG: tetratricopeptide repeat protein, partial [Bacilli bacterium]
MLQHLFEELEEEVKQLEQMVNTDQDKEQILTRWNELKKMSDDIVEGWLNLEELMGEIREKVHCLEKAAVTQISPASNYHYSMDFRKGQGYYHLTMYSEAIKQFQHTITSEPDNELARLYLALSKHSLEDHDEAIQAFQFVSASSSEPKIIAIAHHMLGCIFACKQHYEKSVLYFKRALKHEPNFSDSLFNLAVVYYKLGEYTDSIENLKQLLNIAPDDWEAMLFMSTCLSHLGLNRRALDLKQQAVQISSHPKTELELARSFEEANLYDQSYYWYERLEKHTSFAKYAYCGLTWCSLQQMQRERARGWLKKGLTLYPDHPELQLLHVLMMKTEGQYNKARTILEKLCTHTSFHDYTNHSLNRL